MFLRFHPRTPAILSALFAVGGLHAQPSTTLREVTVTATRTPTLADQLVSDVRVIDRETIEASTARTLPELLARTVGVQFSANGGLGKQSSVFIRGTESRHALLLVDGVRLGSATTGTPSWEKIPLESIERIEVLQGPASAIYGSDAVGGVVQVFTRKGREGLHPHASVTVGSHRHFTAAAGVSGGRGDLRYAAGVQRTRERGFSATNPRVPFGSHNPDVDPFRQDSVNGSLEYRLGGGWALDAAALYSDGTSWYDDGPGRDARAVVRGATAHAALRGPIRQGWQSTLRVSQANDTFNTIVARFPGSFRTEQREYTWQNEIDTPAGLLLAGLERREQEVSGSTAYAVRERSIDSAFAGLNGSRAAHSWQANVRRDRNSQFGGATTGFAGYGWRFAPEWRVNVSHGTSFVAPSFNQLYFPNFGDPTLRPERGRNTELGLTWARGGHELRLVRFDNRIRGFISNTTVAQNIPRARIDGWSLGYTGQFRQVGLYASLDALDPRNEVTGALLPRRARQQAAVTAEFQRAAWAYGASLLHVGERFDDAANRNRLASYTTIDLHARWRFAPAWSLQAKVNNLADRDYETALGYNQPGRSFYLTLRWQPQ